MDSGTCVFSDTMQYLYCFVSTIDNRTVSGTYIDLFRDTIALVHSKWDTFRDTIELVHVYSY